VEEGEREHERADGGVGKMQKRKEPDGKETSGNGRRGMGRMEGGLEGQEGERCIRSVDGALSIRCFENVDRSAARDDGAASDTR